MSNTQHIAIIGAGLSGLCLALSLHHQNIPCTIYESRAQPLDIGGAIMLSPNALRILDTLGVYERLAPLGYHFDNLYFRTEDDKLLDTFKFGSKEAHGYSGMRIYRFELIKVFLEMLFEVGIKPVYGKKFSKVISEDAESSVTWEFADGTTSTARLLVGADGIHSRVRSYIHPDVTPMFTKMAGITAAVPTAQLQPIEDTQIPVTLMNKAHGAFIIAPQRKNGSEVLIGKQFHFTQEYDREGWDRLMSNKQWCVDFLQKGKEDYPPIVARAVSHIPIDGINLWAFYVIPKLDSWTSAKRRVVILGDAAHAIPPTAGQGVNQAFEDVYTFAGVTGKLSASGGKDQKGNKIDVASVMTGWQAARQNRVDRVLELNAQINKRRLPSEGDDFSNDAFDLRWLYDFDFDKMVDEVVLNA